ncbi:MAG: V-type ATP synthase subunit E [Treponema sp.]|nr:V-type ATP synthase subunit E [Treponema sp.]
MDVQLQELIDKIRKDGVASATNSAQNIIAEAEKKAASIISEAEEKADSIIKNAKVETARMEKASEDAITQAGRNLIISFRDGINKELSALIGNGIAKAYDKDLLKKLIPETVKAWVASPDTKDLSVLLSAKDLKTLESGLKTSLKSHISKGLEIKSDDTLSSGFRIGAKDGSAFYDFSAESVAELFSSYLNPKTTELMKNAAAGIPNESAEENSVVEEQDSVPVKKTSTRKRTSSSKEKKEKK